MRKILHLDMDCFYAAVEMKYRPELRGKAIAVGGPPNSRAVITTASYEARKYGVRSAIPSSRAARLCPHLIIVPPNFTLYKKESRAVREIMERYTDKIQPLSLDEAYLDLTEIAQEPGAATRIAKEIKEAVKSELELTISAGLAPNKFLAKVASDWRKPDGLFAIPQQKVAEFVFVLPVEKIWGVGKVTAARMRELGIKTCGDLQKWEVADLKRHFGSRAFDLYKICRGEDDRPVHDGGERKSLSVEETFSTDLSTWEQVKAQIPELYEEWIRRMNRSGDESRIAGAVVKMKFTDFKGMTHEQAGRGFPTIEQFEKLAEAAWHKKEESIRLLGLGVRFSSSETDSDDSQLGFAL